MVGSPPSLFPRTLKPITSNPLILRQAQDERNVAVCANYRRNHCTRYPIAQFRRLIAGIVQWCIHLNICTCLNARFAAPPFYVFIDRLSRKSTYASLRCSSSNQEPHATLRICVMQFRTALSRSLCVVCMRSSTHPVKASAKIATRIGTSSCENCCGNCALPANSRKK